MSDFIVSSGLRAAQLAATQAFADSGSGNSYIVIYDTSENALATLILSKPCGAIADNALSLSQQAPSGDLIALSGVATHASWFAGNGSLVANGAVTDESGAGPFILAGTSGAQIYAGGRAILGVTEIT